MSHYKLQSLLAISLDTNYSNIISSSARKILYKKPSGITGSWDAVLEGLRLKYNIQDGDIDEIGVWEFQSYILVGTLDGYGERVEYEFKKPILYF